MWALALPTCGETTHFRAWHVHLGSQLGTDCCARAASAASATDPFTTGPCSAASDLEPLYATNG
ncbi:hypothetical protein RR46_11509 [Papilio xuthus]|uniref:Uncharacterized protein n=1 Tax=Papilio xuthus TaxID=66420 RepID=A0A194PQS1_PAPXU|nr:hypothetical protein RR46_11509 [Papilio xuthus]